MSWQCTTGNAELPTETLTPEADPAFDVRDAQVVYHPDLDVFVFEQMVTGAAGSLTPEPAGQVDGAPVIGYVFPTNLAPTDVGFGDVEGIVALVATSHPGFDDTPLWDEDVSGSYDDDGIIYHAHWVVLVEDDRAPAGLAVKQAPADEDHVLPPTAPMAMYLDSPGFDVVSDGNSLRIVVPRYRLGNKPAIADLAGAGVDAISGLTITTAEEAIGIARAAGRHGVPVAISLTVETDGRVPSGEQLGEAIARIDADAQVAYFGINCAHPTHFLPAVPADAPWRTRIGMLRANASKKSHAELDDCDTLDVGDPHELASDYAHALARLPGLRAFGGCCGTDLRHVKAICAALPRIASAAHAAL